MFTPLVLNIKVLHYLPSFLASAPCALCVPLPHSDCYCVSVHGLCRLVSLPTYQALDKEEQHHNADPKFLILSMGFSLAAPFVAGTCHCG